MSIEFEKSFYLDLAQKEGLTQAVNRLHHDLWEIEYQCFESESGYNPELWAKLNEMRLFSRELWDLKFKAEFSASRK